jgi:2-keto-3-deoxy-L-fuconate dehydrogenase
MFSLANKVAIVTGGGSGIGKAISTLFAKQGAQVFIFELNETGGAQAVEEIKKQGHHAEVVPCNVADEVSVQKAFAQVYEKTGKLNILVNNAGIAHIGNVTNTSTDDFQKVYEVNVKGAFLCLKYGIEKMLLSGGGAILNMASIASVVGIADRFAYSMSKGAILMMSQSVAKDYIDKGIRSNCISPGRVHTPFVDNFISKNYPGQEAEMFDKLSKSQPIGRMGKPEEMASLALYLCSDEAGFVTGSNYHIDGGFIGVK